MPEKVVERLKYQKVLPQSPVHLENVSGARDGFNLPFETCFGERTASALKNIRNQTLIAKLLQLDREDLKDMYALPPLKKFVDRFFLDAVDNIAIREQLRHATGIELSAGLHTIDMFNPHIISDDIFGQMIIHHVTSFEESLKKSNTTFPRLKERFVQRISQAIRGGVISLNEKRVKETMGLLKYRFVDVLSLGLSDVNGVFHPEHMVVAVAAQMPEDWIEHAFTHEMIHALSGKTVLGYQYPPEVGETWQDQPIHTQTQRTGLCYLPLEMIESHQRFRWLSEAITDVITEALISRASPFYINEKKLLRMLFIRSKVNFYSFQNAYFENYNPELPGEQRIPEWKKLIRLVDESMGKNYLVSLDKAVQEIGIERVLSSR